MTTKIYKQIQIDIANFLKVDVSQFNESDNLILDFHVDSFEIIRLIVFLEEKYSIRYNTMHYRDFTTVSSVVKETIKLMN